IEAGPEFIHGSTPEMQRLLKLADAKTEELPDQHWQFFGHVPRPLSFERVWEQVLDGLREYSGPDRSFADFLDYFCLRLTPDDRALAIEYVEGFNAADKGLVSVNWLRAT